MNLHQPQHTLNSGFELSNGQQCYKETEFELLKVDL